MVWDLCRPWIPPTQLLFAALVAPVFLILVGVPVHHVCDVQLVNFRIRLVPLLFCELRSRRPWRWPCVSPSPTLAASTSEVTVPLSPGLSRVPVGPDFERRGSGVGLLVSFDLVTGSLILPALLDLSEVFSPAVVCGGNDSVHQARIVRKSTSLRFRIEGRDIGREELGLGGGLLLGTSARILGGEGRRGRGVVVGVERGRSRFSSRFAFSVATQSYFGDFSSQNKEALLPLFCRCCSAYQASLFCSVRGLRFCSSSSVSPPECLETWFGCLLYTKLARELLELKVMSIPTSGNRAATAATPAPFSAAQPFPLASQAPLALLVSRESGQRGPLTLPIVSNGLSQRRGWLRPSWDCLRPTGSSGTWKAAE